MSDDPLIGFESDSLVFERLLGKGAMGAVYQGTQVRLNRPVAIKVIAKHLAADKAYVERFNREAQTMGRLSHPNVIACHDFGSVQGPEGELLVMVLEFVDGWSLGSLAKEKRLTVRQVVELHRQAAEGLAAANQLGIVHRDVKPDNLMVTRQGQVKLADFGLAKADDSVMVTQTGAIVGSPAFMSPEAARGEEAGHLGDCYSLACSLYALLAGRPPYLSNSALNVLHQHASAPIPGLAEHGRADLAPLFDPFFRKALAKDPRARFPDSRTLGQALRQLGNQVPPKLLAGAGVSSSDALPAVDAAAATLSTGNMATIATASPAPRRRRSSASQPRAKAAKGAGQQLQLVIGLGALALLLLVGLIAISVGGGGDATAPAPIGASVTTPTATPATPRPVDPGPVATPVVPPVAEPPASDPAAQEVAAAERRQRLASARATIEDGFATVAGFLAAGQLGRAETALDLIAIPQDLEFQDLQDQRALLYDLVFRRQQEAVVAAARQLDAVEAALEAGDAATARALMAGLELPEHPRFDRLERPLFDGPVASPATGDEIATGAGPAFPLAAPATSGLTAPLRLEPGQLRGQMVYAIEPEVPGALPYDLPHDQVWRSGRALDGREQVLAIQLPVPVDGDGARLRLVAHAGPGDRTLRLLAMPAGRELASAALASGAWRALDLPVAGLEPGLRSLVIASSGLEPFHLAEAVIAPATAADDAALDLRGGTLLPVGLTGEGSIESLVRRLLEATRWSWRPVQPTLILPAPADRGESEVLVAELERRLAAIYADVLRANPLAGAVQPRVAACRTKAEVGREIQAARDENVGLLVLGFETDGIPPGAIRNWAAFVRESVSRGTLPVAVLMPQGEGLDHGRLWDRQIEAIRAEDPALPIIDLARALVFADEAGIEWRSDPAVRRELLLTGMEAGLHELLWRLSVFDPQGGGGAVEEPGGIGFP